MPPKKDELSKNLLGNTYGTDQEMAPRTAKQLLVEDAKKKGITIPENTLKTLTDNQIELLTFFIRDSRSLLSQQLFDTVIKSNFPEHEKHKAFLEGYATLT